MSVWVIPAANEQAAQYFPKALMEPIAPYRIRKAAKDYQFPAGNLYSGCHFLVTKFISNARATIYVRRAVKRCQKKCVPIGK